MILFCVAILCFSLPLVILDLDENPNDAVTHFTKNIILDAIYDQYALALGEFNSDLGFTGHH